MEAMQAANADIMACDSMGKGISEYVMIRSAYCVLKTSSFVGAV